MVETPRFKLLLASLLLLYFELVLIRFIPGHVRIVAYFTNFILIACFFGMGLGLLLARSRFDFTGWAPVAVGGVVLWSLVMSRFWVVATGSQALIQAREAGPRPTIPLVLVLLTFYIAISVALVPLGQAVGRGFASTRPLVDYAFNLVGSLLGIGLFSVTSALSLAPWSWFLIGTPALLLIGRPPRRWRPLVWAVAFGVPSLLWIVRGGSLWSPYHKIDFATMLLDTRTGILHPDAVGPDAVRLPPEVGFNVRVNDDFYQLPVDLSDASLARYPALGVWRRQYDLPFMLKPGAKRVLIVGAGTGNDAAAALRGGAREVDVVEIDPRIAAIGRDSHPEKPYKNPRVRVFVDDARHFFHVAKPGYDVIVFGLLDSHRLLGYLSSLRLDSYLFTVESFKEAKHLLAPDGIQVTAFALAEPIFASRLYEMLRMAYGTEPAVVHEQGILTIGVVMVSGPGLAELRFPHRPHAVDARAELATDDWPFFYARARAIPKEYLITFGLVLLLSFGVLAGTAGKPGWSEAHFFFLGAGFLLLETRNVTACALVFGSTWQVNAVVFASFLVVALLSAWLAARNLLDVNVAYLGLAAAVGLNAFAPLQALSAFDVLPRLLLVGGLTALPVLFSGIVFAASFRDCPEPARALSANLVGSVFGGTLEYFSMVGGIRSLLAGVALLYLASWMSLRASDRAVRALG